MEETYMNISKTTQSDFSKKKLRKSNETAPFKIFYIGNGSNTIFGAMDALKLQHLVTFDNCFDAAYHLLHSSGSIPEAIISHNEANVLKDIIQFRKFLSENDPFSEIPFILVNQKDNIKEIKEIKGRLEVDDIIKHNISSEELFNKIRFIKKFKALKKSNAYSYPSDDTNKTLASQKVKYILEFLFKRFIDILFSATALIIFSPVILLIALIIKIDSKGPVFYTSYRSGSNYRIFKFIKFRSMIEDADKKLSTLQNQYDTADKNSPVFFKVSNDPRTTRFGRFIRNTSLDELPQLFNVLKGDMSLVGNRPLPLYEAKTLTTDKHVERFDAPAGITGLWQVKKRGNKEMSVEERVALDIDYAKNHSFWYDMKIMLITPKALVQKDNV